MRVCACFCLCMSVYIYIYIYIYIFAVLFVTNALCGFVANQMRYN